MKCIIAINLYIALYTAKHIEENHFNGLKSYLLKKKQQITQKNHWQFLANVIRQENETIVTNMEKIQKLVLFAGNMIVYIENQN